MFPLICITCSIILFINTGTALHVYHSLPESELLNVVARSWEQNGLTFTKIENIESMGDSLVIFVNQPRVMNLCRTDELRRHLVNLNSNVILDDAAKPSVLVGSANKIHQYLQQTDMRFEYNEDMMHVLREDVGVGMSEDNRVYHYQRGTRPCILTVQQGNLNLLFRFANYIPNVNAMVDWEASTTWHGYCHVCDEITSRKHVLTRNDKVVIVGFIFEWTPLLSNWLDSLLNQVLPRDVEKFYLIYNNVTQHDAIVQDRTQGAGYDGLVLDSVFFKDKDLNDIRRHSTVMCEAVECTYMFSVDSEVTLLRSNIITHLAQYNKSVITAPVTHLRERSNFWGDITEDGWYRRSPDYFDIIDGAWGLFVVPYITSMYLTRADALPDYATNDKYEDGDSDMAMAENYRNSTTLMWFITTLTCAVYTDMTPSPTLPLPDPDLYAADANWHGWVDYSLNKPVAFHVEDAGQLLGACADSMVLPLYTDRYCSAFVTALSSYTWSPNTSHAAQLVRLSELLYQVIAEGMILQSVGPYVRDHFNPGGKLHLDNEEMWLFIQDPTNTELGTPPDSTKKEEGSRGEGSDNGGGEEFHVLWFWTDNPDQGVNFPEESCKSHLAPGSFIVLRASDTVHLIHTEERNIGVYTRITFK